MGSKELRNAQGQTKEEFEAANKEIDQQNEELKNLSNNITSTAAAVRTLGDYASDLSSIFKRSFELRFDRQSTFDAITSGWASIAKASQDANDNILELNATVKSLSADKALKQYFLSVAEAYGDAVSAARLRADIAGIDANLASKTQELTAAQDKSNKTLKGNSAAAIANRNTVRGMVTNYQAYIESLIKSGASQATINKAIRDGKADFIAQATQLGYNTTELQTYTAAFDDMVQIVKSVPSNVNVKFTASMTAADKALAEFAARAKASGSTAGKDFADAFNNGVKKANDKFIPVAKKPTFGENLLTNIGIIFDWISGASYKPLVPLWANGGYTGAGGKYEPAGIVHKGEYVVPASQVNQNTGMPYYMQQQRSFASGGFARASGPMMVTLAPEDRALLRNVGGSGEVVLYANNEAIARSSNAGNKSIVAAGGRP
jgi:hypothetical protein